MHKYIYIYSIYYCIKNCNAIVVTGWLSWNYIYYHRNDPTDAIILMMSTALTISTPWGKAVPSQSVLGNRWMILPHPSPEPAGKVTGGPVSQCRKQHQHVLWWETWQRAYNYQHGSKKVKLHISTFVVFYMGLKKKSKVGQIHAQQESREELISKCLEGKVRKR